MISKLKNFLSLSDDEYDMYEEEEIKEQHKEERVETKKTSNQHQRPNVVSISTSQQPTNVILLEPRTYAEAQDICDHIKNRRSVIINLQRMEKSQQKRIVDFLTGTVYALDGDMQKLGAQTFICTPDNVSLSGTITDYIQENEGQGSRW